MTDYVLDTMALVRYLEDDLPRGADRVVREAEKGDAHLFLPEIVLGEFLYIALRGRLRTASPPARVEELLGQVLDAPFLTLSSLSSSAWQRFLRVDIPELHDRIIATDALSRGIPLVSSDPAFSAVPDLQVVWR